jgi:hypothetical protein
MPQTSDVSFFVSVMFAWGGQAIPPRTRQGSCVVLRANQPRRVKRALVRLAHGDRPAPLLRLADGFVAAAEKRGSSACPRSEACFCVRRSVVFPVDCRRAVCCASRYGGRCWLRIDAPKDSGNEKYLSDSFSGFDERDPTVKSIIHRSCRRHSISFLPEFSHISVRAHLCRPKQNQ